MKGPVIAAQFSFLWKLTRPSHTTVNYMIQEARSRARMAAQEAKLTEKERIRRDRDRLAKRRARRLERENEEWQHRVQKEQAKRQEADEAAEQVVEFLKAHLGAEYPAFLELAGRAGSTRIGQKLGISDMLF